MTDIVTDKFILLTKQKEIFSKYNLDEKKLIKNLMPISSCVAFNLIDHKSSYIYEETLKKILLGYTSFYFLYRKKKKCRETTIKFYLLACTALKDKILICKSASYQNKRYQDFKSYQKTRVQNLYKKFNLKKKGAYSPFVDFYAD